MTETVTSKYFMGYWIQLFGFPAAVVFLILFLGIDQGLKGILCVSVLLIGSFIVYFVKFSISTPRSIIISPENITVDQYIFRKHIIIKYSDIDTSGTTRPVETKFPSMQSLVLELHNGTSFRINEGDFVNYGEMKQAIYDHLFRGK